MRGTGVSRSLFLLIALLSTTLALALGRLGDQPIVHDSQEYVRIAQFLISGKLDGWNQRTYGYPVFLMPLLWLSNGDTITLKLLVFWVQLGVYLGACWLFARRVEEAFGSVRVARVTLVLTALNPYALILTGIVLTDLLSVALITVAAALLLPPRNNEASPKRVLRDGVLLLVVLALAAETRPANAILLPIGGLLWLVRWWWVTGARRRGLLAGGCLLVAVAATLPIVPQIAVNWTLYQEPSPLTVRPLYAEQIDWGLTNLKFATFVPRAFDGEPPVYYRSPFVAGQADPVAFLLIRPHLLAATLALHAFGLLDQDLPFVYVSTLHPWYRWPFSIVNYLLLWLMAIGLVLGWRRWWRPGTRLAWGVLVCMGAGYLLLYLPTAVECRFGVPLFVLLTPGAALTVVTVRDAVRARNWRQAAGFGVGAALSVAICAPLSAWLQTQSPVIMATREIRRLPQLHAPVARFDSVPPDRWTIEQRQRYIIRATNLGEQTWYSIRPARVFVHVMFVGPGGSDVVATRVPIERPVLPGQQLDMRVTVSAPHKVGTYRLCQQIEIGELSEGPGQSAWPPQETTVVVTERRQ